MSPCKLLAATLVGASFLATAAAEPSPLPYHFTHNIAPRLQWNENSGYCGETSFISAGLHFGQYCSQFTARSLASPGVNQADPSNCN